MRILLVAHSFPRNPTDMAGSFLLALAKGVQSQGHDVTAVVPHAAGLASQETLDGVRVRRYRYAADASETLAYHGTMHEQVLASWRARFRMIKFIRASRRETLRAVAELAPDVIHVHWWFPGGFAVWPLAGRVPPVVLTSHGTDLFLLDRFAPARPVAKRVFRFADEVTVISTPLVNRVQAMGVPHERITVIPMPVLPSVFDTAGAEPRDPSLLLFVGRLIERKGCAYALEALRALRNAGRDVRLTVIGDGPELDSLRRRAADLDVAGQVAFTGALAPGQVAQWNRRASVLLMPAVTDWKGEQEGFGMVLVEAMLSGLPIVASRSGGIPDVIDHERTGLLVPERDPEALADAVARLLDDGEFAAQTAERAKVEASTRFAPDSIARRFSQVYQRAAVRRGAPARGGKSG